MKMSWWKWLQRYRRGAGPLVILLGLVIVTVPFAAGSWALGLAGVLVILAAGLQWVETLRSRDRRLLLSSYLEGCLLLISGLVLLVRPSLAVGFGFTIIALIFAADGVQKLVTAWQTRSAGRIWIGFYGLFSLLLAAGVLWVRAGLGVAALGLVIGLWVVSKGWALLMMPVSHERAGAEAGMGVHSHPDARLNLGAVPEIDRLHRQIRQAEVSRLPFDRTWAVTLIVVFFAIHLGRMQVEWTLLDMVAPLVAVVGDVAGAILLSSILLIPGRLVWRRLTRPMERRAWMERLSRRKKGSRGSRQQIPEWLTDRWLDARIRLGVRLRRARESVWSAAWLALRTGLPWIAVLVAVNPIWGFTWYFNSENWVSGVWEAVAARRVVEWRLAMAEAVAAAYPDQDPTALFRVSPEGVEDGQDFTFLVIGDPGEGDGSQWALVNRYLELGRRDDVKFLVISSDVIYPDGAMKDYELNFYLPYKGFRKPIYAIPGNHDWFDGLTGFSANFFEPTAARAAIRARLGADFGLSRVEGRRAEQVIAEAARLRREYRLQVARQKAPYFELSTDRFALLAVDTGVLKKLDQTQLEWLAEALERNSDRFTMALLGHPVYAGGSYQAHNQEFANLHELLRKHRVPLVMAGDTHDFEFYLEETVPGDRPVHHFVNGGGGAYLSIGTALDWPAGPAVRTFAFYPDAGALHNKLDAQTPGWKQPIWWWVKNLRARPFSVEALSAVFDFNRSPYFQSLMEVQVLVSRGEVRLLLHGVNGPLRWQDLGRSTDLPRAGTSPDQIAVWTLPLLTDR